MNTYAGPQTALENTESMVELEKVASKIVLGNRSFRGESPSKNKLSKWLDWKHSTVKMASKTPHGGIIRLPTDFFGSVASEEDSGLVHQQTRIQKQTNIDSQDYAELE